MESSQSRERAVPVPDLSQLTLAPTEDQAVAIDGAEPTIIPPHLSHDPENNLKRSDPFQFGSRYLSETENVFQFNAWDHVETDDTYKEYAEEQYAKQREAPVSDFDKSKQPLSFSHTLWWFCRCFLMIEYKHSSSEVTSP